MPNLVKSSLLLLALTVCGAGISRAQAPTDAPPAAASPAPTPAAAPVARTGNPNKQTKELSKKLGLSMDQTAKVQPILADRDQRLQALTSDTTLDPKSVKKQRRAIMMDADQKLNAVLTPDQQQQWATLKADHKQGAQGQSAPAPAPPSVM